MNYDFELHWEDRIMPLIKTERIQKAIKKGLVRFLNIRKEEIIERDLSQEEKLLCGRAETELYKVKRKHYELHDERFKRLKFDKNKFPFEYGRGDVFLCEEEEKDIIEDLINWGILKVDTNEPKLSDYADADEYDDACDEYFNSAEGVSPLSDLYREYKDEIIEPYMRAYKEKKYKSYCCYSSCFSTNPNFCLELAKMVMPNVVWKVKKSNIHATIVSENEELVFDILYYDKETLDFGGKKAINDTNNKISHDEHSKLSYELHNTSRITTKRANEIDFIKDQKYNDKYIK
jgi:hypothetical protein